MVAAGPENRPAPRPADVAIVGMSAIMPGAPNLRRFFENILDKVSSINEVPADRWPAERYFDADRATPDKIASKWGGFLPDVPFDPMRYGIPPASVGSIDPAQLLALVAAEAALADAGLAEIAPELRRRAAVILGFTGGLGELGLQYAARAELARALPHTPAETLDFLPEWTSDSFAGLLPNVIAGRIANRFDLGGANFVVDAACATSLAALRQGVMELESGRSDLVLCGAVEAGQGPFAFTCFSKAQALSPQGRCRAFDAEADGTALGEGVAMLVLRRLADAEAAGDRIYAVIKGIDGSSDGRARGLMAPRPEGQRLALDRAYAQAGYSPASVELFEAHGTGTVAGDASEIESLSSLLAAHGAGPRSAALGSVKTLIGHAEGAAGVAGVVKAALSLHHRVLPPHAGVETPNAALGDGPLALYATARPWLTPPAAPRRAGISAFGFGGANYHVALQEHAPHPHGEERILARVEPRDSWPSDLLVWRAADQAALAALAMAGAAALEAGARPPLGALARTLWKGLGRGPATMAIVAGSHDDLARLLSEAVHRLGAADAAAKALPPGLFLSNAPLAADGRVAMLFAGQGSQYPDMAAGLAATFPEVAAVLDDADAIVAATPSYRERHDPRLSRLIFPPARFDDAAETAARQNLAATEAAQPALGSVEAAMLALTDALGLAPSMVAGHSYGEYVALHAAGVLSRADMLRLSEARGRAIVGATRDGDLGTMAAVAADAERVRAALGDADVVIANLNAPSQTVISGARPAIAAAIERLAAEKLAATPIPVAAAFHSPLMQPAQAPLVAFFDEVAWASPRLPVYANTTAAPHDADPAKIRALLGRHLTAPVDFVGTIEAMYAAGARVFLEIGPKAVLTGLTRRILGARPHIAIALDGAGGGLDGLLHALGALVVQGVSLDLARLFAGRDLAAVDATRWTVEDAGPTKAAGWLVNGSRARRDGAPIKTAVAARPATETTPRPTRRPTKETDMHGHSGPAPHDDQPDESPAGGRDRAMAEHQETMRQFLQTQERLMMAYLGGAAGSQGAQRPARPFSTPRPAPTLTAPRAPVPAPKPALTPSPGAPAASVAQSPPAKAAATPAAPAVAAGDAKAQLLAIAADRTGYPEDMLGLDMDLEADLGIDSIKRVEILGAFRKAQPDAVSVQLQPHMEKVAKAKTLREVLDRIAEAMTSPASATPVPTAAETPGPFESTGSAPGAALTRYVMRPEPESLPAGQPTKVAQGFYILVPDQLGIAAALAISIAREGSGVRLVPDGLMADDAELTAWLGQLRAKGRIRGLVSCASILPPDTAPRDAATWQSGMDSCVKSLFPLLRLAAPDLAHDGRVIIASAMGGRFGRDAREGAGHVFPGAGGGVGLVKTLAMEWERCRCKAVDLDLAEDVAALAAHLHAELAADVGRREVGYPAGTRTIFRTTPAPLARAAAADARPDRDWVVLAVGGARGITAETLRPFAQAGATCVLVSRAALPGPEDAASMPHADAASLRRHFLKDAATGGTRPTPAKIEAKVQGVLRDREIRANLADFSALGATLDAHTCDVREEGQVAALLDALYARHGRIDAVLLGAGLIEDKLVVDKTRESLDRVFDTKVDGAFFFARHLRPQSLRFLALFSSVAGRYGNRGQADYAAANEILNRLAWQLQARFGSTTKVVSVNWGAWARTTHGLGMLTPETTRQFRERGLKLIEPEPGGRFLVDELLFAPPDEVEVIAGEHDWDAYEDAAGRATPDADTRRVA